MTETSYRSIIQVIGIAGILPTIAVGLPLPQSPEKAEYIMAPAADQGLRVKPGAIASTFVQPHTVEENTDGTDPVPKNRPTPITETVAVLGHYPSYAAYVVPVECIRYDKLTHISYFSLWPLADGNLDISDINVPDLDRLVGCADANGVRTLVTVGGWERSRHFSAMAAGRRSRDNFATKLLLFCLEHNLAGADLDWEPVLSPTDIENYSLLIESVHKEFEPLGLLLFVSVSALGREVELEVIDLIDLLNVMAYDGVPPQHSTFEFALSALHHWENYGVPRNKLMLGVPFYGRNEDGTGYSYSDIFSTYHPGPDDDFVDGIGFNGANTIMDKTAYVIRNGYHGIMIWELSQDTCGRGSLLNAVADTVASFTSAIPDVNVPLDVNELQIGRSAHKTLPAKNAEINCVNSRLAGSATYVSYEVLSAEMVGSSALLRQKVRVQ